MAVYDNKAADELARAKCWHRAGENGIIYPRPKGKAVSKEKERRPKPGHD